MYSGITMRIVFATHNIGKVKEMRALLADMRFDVVSMNEAGILEDVVEDGATFEENALKKARFAAERAGARAIADDSGICIQALDNKPGVYSARWAGDDATSEMIVAHTLRAMQAVPPEKRQAWFESALALVAPDGRSWTFSGRVGGSVTVGPRGVARPKLPYDQIFVPDGHTRTFAEMSDEEKNGLSHRGLAFQKLKDFLKSHSLSLV